MLVHMVLEHMLDMFGIFEYAICALFLNLIYEKISWA